MSDNAKKYYTVHVDGRVGIEEALNEEEARNIAVRPFGGWNNVNVVTSNETTLDDLKWIFSMGGYVNIELFDELTIKAESENK